MSSILIRLPDELHRQVKIKAAQDGTTITAVVIDLLGAWTSGASQTFSQLGKQEEAVVGRPEDYDWGKASREPGVKVMEEPTIDAAPLPPAKGRRKTLDLSKAAQAKGKMGR